MSDEEVEKSLKELAKHFNEPVMPISRYCEGLRTWQHAVERGAYDEELSEWDRKSLKQIADATAVTFLAIMKSALLSRLLYDGEPLRKVKCPVHKGRWSGCKWGRIECVSDEYPQGCYAGSNVTGWLPDAEELARQREWHENNGWPLRKAEAQTTVWTAEDFTK